jgi:hypothetical protein
MLGLPSSTSGELVNYKINSELICFPTTPSWHDAHLKYRDNFTLPSVIEKYQHDENINLQNSVLKLYVGGFLQLELLVLIAKICWVHVGWKLNLCTKYQNTFST